MISVQALLIAGPTASGKSSLAVKLAQALDGVVINADSMQGYYDAPLLTAQPSSSEKDVVPHYLFGTLPCSEKGSVGNWLRAAKTVYLDMKDQGKMPIFVGGTGLYLESLFRGLASLPEIPDNIRERFATMREQQGSGALFRQLLDGDPEAAEAIGPNDPQRLQRALEVMETTNRSLISFHNENAPPLLEEAACLPVVNTLPREHLYEHINSRFDRMVTSGAMDEVQHLMSKNLSADHPLAKAIGVPQLRAYFEGSLTLDDAITLAKRDSRRYAKRQLTWCRQRFADWLWFENEPEDIRVTAILEAVKMTLETPASSKPGTPS